MDKFYPPKPKINAFNDLFTCYLCQGYMINPTTIDVCTHTYCRSCIARHLAADCTCPQCDKTISTSNLQSDDILRSIIFKLVPGLYQKERERLVQFVNKTKHEGKLIGATEESLMQLLDTANDDDDDDDLFSPTDPISLSLEFHPVLAEQCPEGSVPPVRYLQCPASVKVQHLKRFLCSKFEIDLHSRRVGIDIIYEDEVLPSDFTLMDIGYCYKWHRHAPLKLTYRILIYQNDLPTKYDNGYVSDDKVSENSYKSNLEDTTQVSSILRNTASYTADSKTLISMKDGDEQVSAATQQTKTFCQTGKFKSSKSSALKPPSLHATPFNPEVPVKVTISRKPAEIKKSVSKKSSSADEFVIPTPTNDFKSLRSNDIRFSDYAITSSTTNTVNGNSHNNYKLNELPKCVKKETREMKEEKVPKCDIVVSIPHNQMQDEWDTKPLSQLKTASKKSPSSSGTDNVAAAPAPKKVRNVPKLKIELNSLKTKLIEKPKSADIRLDTLMLKQHRPRKFSLDEPQPVVDKVDLETYVKNIGLKPIEIQTTTTNKVETTDKYTPNASPMSSSSSTTSSSLSNFNFKCRTDITSSSSSSSSSHKKRKKKHSKDSRQSKDSKRKKMHAEISSHSAEESLKMKVKLTAPISLKSLKSESKKYSHYSTNKISDTLELQSIKFPGSKVERKSFEKTKSHEDKTIEKANEKYKSRSSEIKKSKAPDSKYFQDIQKLKNFDKSTKPLEIKISVEDNSKKSFAKEFDDDEDLTIPDSTSLGISKSLVAIKEAKLPHSPPLPPSLFKTTPLTFSTFSPNVTTVAKPKHVTIAKDYKDKPKISQVKPIAPKPIAAKPTQPLSMLSSSTTFKTPHFAVPNPPRFMTSNTTKFLSTPTSIASAANKHMGNLLKRSISLDDNKSPGPLKKQQKLEKPNQITVSAYVCNLHMTKVDVPPTPTSSTAKATYEIPLYSPLSASYNPKCSFSVNSMTAAAKSTKATLQHPTNSTAALTKNTFTAAAAAAVAANQTDVEGKKATINDTKPSMVTASSTAAATIVNTNNKKTTKTAAAAAATTTTSSSTPIATLMGPPLPIQKFNSNLTVVPAAVKSPPLSTVLPLATPTSTVTSIATTQHMPVLNTAYLSSPLSMVNYRQSKVLLAHAKPTNLAEMKMETTATTAAAGASTVTTTTTAATTKPTVSTTNGLTAEKPKSSLRQFRLPSRESGQDILDLSASAKVCMNNGPEKQLNRSTTITIPATNSQMTTSAGSSLEIALNKIKQNMTTTTTSSYHNASSSVRDSANNKQELLSPISDDLQNLHLLSESATAREKIAISTTAASSSSTSLYEKAKITQNSLVRHQNASVRNIPNPSALAFRNQQPGTIIPPMVTIAAGGLATNLTELDKPLLLKTPSPPKSPHTPNISTSSTSPSRFVSKKHPSIDQVAASLNQRASAAAEASAAKANFKRSDETALVTSTSSPLNDNKLENKEIKQEPTEVQSDTASAAAQPSSTVNLCSLVNIPDIKKGSEEELEEEEEAANLKPSSFINVTTKKPTMVENLVTSVINVTTPTSSTLLTATSAAGF